MKEEMELVRQIKALKTDQLTLRSERETIFLAGLRKKLELYIVQNPARPVTASLHWQLWNYVTQNAKSGRLYTEQTGNGARMGKFENFYYNIKESNPFINLKNIGLFNNTYASGAVLAIIVLAIGVGTIASASQTSLPGDNFYPIKILSEELRSAITVSPAAKARLETEFSTKRIEEIKKVVQKSGIESKNIDVALERLQKNTTKAADIIDREKKNGNDVFALEKDIEEKNAANQNMLEQILKKSKREKEESNEHSDKDAKETEGANTEVSDKKERENKKRESGIKKEEPKPVPNLQDKKTETKKDTGDATASSEIKIKTRAEKDNDGSDREYDENND